MPKRSKPAPCQLTPEYVEWVHDHLIGTLWPDVDPVSAKEYRSLGLLESALARPFYSAGGQDAYPSVIEKATALFHSMIANHPFQNGNKRTAVIAVDAFLLANGYTIALDNDKMYEMAKKTADYKSRGLTHDQSLEEIKSVLLRFTVPLHKFYLTQKKDKSLSKLYKAQISIRRSVRRHSLIIPT